MKEVHLICNAHLDPIWQWEWEEGAASALSTFRAAADLANEFDYIFCHNEVTLYKYIEEYAPELFERIKKLVREGKWHIMGGWYLQPDCNMPQGESFIRQIQVGHRYFSDKFGVKPTTAINFDAFGHTRGLVQIIKKCGQDSDILVRLGDRRPPSRVFNWEGFDGSQIKVCAVTSGYNSPLGGAADTIRRRAESTDGDVICVLWGVGNHGGGPSRKDLKDIEKLMADGKMQILHSTPEAYFAKIDPQVVWDKSLRTSMPGCYTSMSRVKQGHANLENNLYMTEKLCSAASMRGLIEYPEKDLDEATEDLLNCEFHDVLPGSCVKNGEENGLTLIAHGMQILNHLRARAFFALSSAEPSAKDGEYPILVFNPMPYEWQTDIICELSLADQNWKTDIHSHMRIVDEKGNTVPSQMIKEESTINLDWRKRFIFRANIKPLAVTRFSVYFDYEPEAEDAALPTNSDVIFDCGGKHVEIDGKTGLLKSYRIDGVELISPNALCPYFMEDNEDPWGMGTFQLAGIGRNPVPFVLMQNPDGPFCGLSSIEVIEDGDIYTGVECFFSLQNTKIRIEYDIYRNSPDIDIKLDVFMDDANRVLKLALPLSESFSDGEYFGQTAFGAENLYTDGCECVAGRFVAMRPKNGEKCIALLNRGTYGSSYSDGVISMSLLRGATYCAHPIQQRRLVPENRYTKKIDMGERNFAFRLTYAFENELERLATEFNTPPYALNVFPIKTDKLLPEFRLSIDNRIITLVTLKQQSRTAGTYLLRLFNGSSENQICNVSLGDGSIQLSFVKYEVKTVKYENGTLTECDMLII